MDKLEIYHVSEVLPDSGGERVLAFFSDNTPVLVIYEDGIFKDASGYKYRGIVRWMELPEIKKVEQNTVNFKKGRSAHISVKMGVDPDLPTAANKWEKMQKERLSYEKKYYEEHGEYPSFGGATR